MFLLTLIAETMADDLEVIMLVNWIRDVDAALAQARVEDKPLLIDFSAAPA